jgi:glutathione peroxidase-family protein
MGTINDTKKTTQQIAQQVAKQIAEEPFEILKQAGKQVSGTEPQEESSTRGPLEEKKEVTPQLKEKIKVQGERQLQALQKEVEDIKEQKIFANLQKRIAEGEEVPLDDYPELSREEKEVLKAQMLAVLARKKKVAEEKPLVEPAVKPSRKLFDFGPKTQAERQKTHVERPLPPSG